MLFESLKRTAAATAISLAIVMMPLVAAAQATGSFGAPASGSFGGTVTGTVNNGTGPSSCGNGPCSVNNPLGGTTSLCGLIKKLFEAVVAIAIPVAVLFIIWSGFQFVFAQGNKGGLQKAKKNFLYTIVGIAIFLGAWLLATIIASTVNAIGGGNIISCN